uniref:Putative secreted protein n=1 Tax=Rhipicephalus microplus TaxID=6941 RepID=A0A6M2D9N5_RHIMP
MLCLIIFAMSRGTLSTTSEQARLRRRPTSLHCRVHRAIPTPTSCPHSLRGPRQRGGGAAFILKVDQFLRRIALQSLADVIMNASSTHCACQLKIVKPGEWPFKG